MQRAIAAASSARTRTSPNPWVGCVILAPDGSTYEGATEPPGGPHAEVVALSAAGDAAAGSTLVCTLESCSHYGRTPPCVDAIVAARVARVVIAVEDPDPHVNGAGVRALRAAGIDVEVGVSADEVGAPRAPALKHRITGRPDVVRKLAATLDGRTAAPDGTSQWITGELARRDAHRLRAESDAVIVGAGTVRTDDPALTVRHVEGRDPLRVVLGRAPEAARVHPALEMDGDLSSVLDELGRQGVVQAMVEGGATVAAAFHRAGLVDRYVVYIAPALFGGEDARGLFTGPGVATIDDLWRGRLVAVDRIGEDLRLEMEPV